jgi:hypothetical protein
MRSFISCLKTALIACPAGSALVDTFTVVPGH